MGKDVWAEWCPMISLEDMWSVEVRTALKSPPIILSVGGREGKGSKRGTVPHSQQVHICF